MSTIVYSDTEKVCPPQCFHVWTMAKGGKVMWVRERCFASRSTANLHARKVGKPTMVRKCAPGCPCAAFKTYDPHEAREFGYDGPHGQMFSKAAA